MAMIVAASSLYHSLKDLEQEERRETQQKVYAVPGLSLNPNTLIRGKDSRVLLELQPLASKQILILPSHEQLYAPPTTVVFIIEAKTN